MLRRVKQEIYGDMAEEFLANASPDDSARTLASCTPRAGTAHSVIGRVSVDRVVLRVRRSNQRNSFAPHFSGRFILRNNATLLRGQFQLHRPVQIFLTIWLGFPILLSVLGPFLGVAKAIARGKPLWLGLLGGVFASTICVLFALLGLVVVRLGKRLSESDVLEIRRHIQMSLAKSHGAAPPTSPALIDQR